MFVQFATRFFYIRTGLCLAACSHDGSVGFFRFELQTYGGKALDTKELNKAYFCCVLVFRICSWTQIEINQMQVHREQYGQIMDAIDTELFESDYAYKAEQMVA